MGLSDYKINSFSKPVSALDDAPQMSAAELKAWFDSNSANELKNSVNGIIDELKDVDVSTQHTHANKDILDNISESPIYDAPSDGKMYARKDGVWSKFGGIPSIVYTELDNFTDGICKVTPKSPNEYLYFDEGVFIDTGAIPVCIASENYALCIAYHTSEIGDYWYYQMLIFAHGEIYIRQKHDYEPETGMIYGEWGEWEKYKPRVASRADFATKAQQDYKGNVITDTYATKAEVGDIETALDTYATKAEVGDIETALDTYATKAEVGDIEAALDTYATKAEVGDIETALDNFATKAEGIPSIVYTEIDNFLDGVCKVTPKSADEPFAWDGEKFSEEYTDEYITSEMYALCLAYKYEWGAYYAYHTYYQMLIFPDGNIYTRRRTSDYDPDTDSWSEPEWSNWTPFMAKKARNDEINRRIVDTYATKEELADSKKWKTLIDVTLTEEQAGVNEILLAIEDVEAFINARQIRIAVSFPVAEAKAVNSFWTAFRICDADKTKYNQTVLAGYNTKCDANATYFADCLMNMSDFKYSNPQQKTYLSLSMLPTPWYMASANTVKTGSVASGGLVASYMRECPPYLNIATGSVTLEAGAHIFMEVCE